MISLRAHIARVGLRLGSSSTNRLSIHGRRVRLERLCSYLPVPRWTVAKPRALDGVAVEAVEVRGARADRILLYVHGGAFCLGSARSHRGLVARICREGGARALSVDYRRAPEHPFPAPLDDVVSVYRSLLREGADPRRMVVAGDSAGANLALLAMIAARDAGEPLPAALVLLSPSTDLTGESPSLVRRARLDPYLNAELLVPLRRAYIPDSRTQSARASPLFADLRALPPILIQVGTHEILYDDSIRFAQRAREAGVDVTLEIGEGLWHVWQVTAPLVPEARQAIRRIGSFMRSTLPPADS